MSIDRRVDKGDVAHTYNGILLSHEKENRPTDFKNKLMVPRGKDGGRDSQGVWDGHGHTAGFNMENQQRPAGQLREVSSILCNNLMVIQWMWGRDSHGAWDARGHTAVFNMENQQGLLSSPGKSAQYSVITGWFLGGKDGGGIVRESGMDMDTRLCLTWRTSKALLGSTGNSAQCHVAAGMGG